MYVYLLRLPRVPGILAAVTGVITIRVLHGVVHVVPHVIHTGIFLAASSAS